MERRIAPSVQIEAAIEAALLDGLSDPDRLGELGRLGARLVLDRPLNVGTFRGPTGSRALGRSSCAGPLAGGHAARRPRIGSGRGARTVRDGLEPDHYHQIVPA